MFPAESSSVDVVAAFSVFSHMTLPSINHYLRESARVMRPGGRFLFTAYALTSERLDAIGHGKSKRAFQEWREGSMVLDPRSPERAIAHPLESFLSAIEGAELCAPDGCRFGAWLGRPDYEGGQDLFVAIKP